GLDANRVASAWGAGVEVAHERVGFGGEFGLPGLVRQSNRMDAYPIGYTVGSDIRSQGREVLRTRFECVHPASDTPGGKNGELADCGTNIEEDPIRPRYFPKEGVLGIDQVTKNYQRRNELLRVIERHRGPGLAKTHFGSRGSHQF